jgi:hypothetical protein
VIAAVLAGCGGPAVAVLDQPAPDGVEETDETRPEDTGDTGVPFTVPHCPRDPCVSTIAEAVAIGTIDSWFGYDLAVTTDGGTRWLAVGAPIDPGSSEKAGAYLLALPSLEPAASWLSDESYDSAGLSVDVMPGASVMPSGYPRVAVGVPGAHEEAPAGGLVAGLAGWPALGAELQTAADVAIHGTDQAYERLRLGFHVKYLALDETGEAELVAAGVGSYEVDDPGSGVYAFRIDLQGSLTEAVASRALTSADAGLSFPLGWDADGDGVDDLTCHAMVDDTPSIVRFESPWETDLRVIDAATTWRSVADEYPKPMADIGDITGDGLPDLGAGLNTWSGGAERAGGLWILPGGELAGGSLFDAPIVLEGDEPGEAFGNAAVGADVDGDGNTDLVASAYGIMPYNEPGKVLVFPGPLALGPLSESDASTVVYAEEAYEMFGIEMAAIDADANGRDDIVVSATQWHAGQGKVYLLLGEVLAP